MNPEKKLWTGIALVVVGAAIGITALRSSARREAEIEAAARAAAAASQAAAQRLAADQSAIETKAKSAAAIEPLNAALGDNVNGPTLLDLFDDEDWWQPYRDDLAGARVIVGDELLAAWRQADLGTQDAEAVRAARKRGAASGVVTIGGQRLVLGAARFSSVKEGEPVLVLLRRSEGAVATNAPAAGPAAPEPPLPLIAGGACVLLGLGVAASGRMKRSRSKPDNFRTIASVHTPWPVEGDSSPGLPPLPAPSGIPAHMPRVPSQPLLAPRSPVTLIEEAPVMSSAMPAMTAMTTPPAPISAPSVAMAPPALSSSSSSASAALATATPEPALRAAFGRYRVLDRLGEGGMAEVYTAEASGVEGFTRTFVLKRLRPELSRDKNAVAQFINEARMQASLVHSNIVPVFDFGVVDGEYFMTEEYIIGRDLIRLVVRQYEFSGECLDPRVAYYLAHETLLALSYAHGKRDRNGSPLHIVHRDVSPGNIMVSLAGEVKLSDFGIAKASSRVTSTQMGLVKGNANFMSPEQARGQSVDGRSDLFSLGEVLYYLLTSELLYGGENDLDVLFKAATGPTEEHIHRIRTLPRAAAQILEKALAFDPRHRFQTAAEFADALAPHVGDGKAQVMKLMPLLFGDELRFEAA